MAPAIGMNKGPFCQVADAGRIGFCLKWTEKGREFSRLDSNRKAKLERNELHSRTRGRCDW
jgi:hypothetical protein